MPVPTSFNFTPYPGGVRNNPALIGTPITSLPPGYVFPGDRPKTSVPGTSMPTNPYMPTVSPAGSSSPYYPLLSNLPASPAPSGIAGLPSTTAGGNLAAGPTLESLGNMVDQLNLQAQQQANLGRIPGEAGLEAKSSSNIGSLLGGNIPTDVTNLLSQQAAERGIATGTQGSDANNSALLRALGLTSLGLEQQGQSDLSSAVARNPAAPIFNPSQFLLTPFQSGELSNEQNRTSLDYLRALQGAGGGYRPSGGGGLPPMDTSTGTSGNDQWWNSLFPSGTGTGTPVITTDASGNPVFTSSTTTTPGGSTLVQTNQNWNDLFGAPVDTSGGVPPDTISGVDQSTYDPFAQYGDFSGG